MLPSPIEDYTPSNAYLIEGEIPTLIDAGHPPAVAQGVLEEQLHCLGYTAGDIKQIIYTHHHMDHSGGGVILSQIFQMNHLIHSNFVNEFRDSEKLHHAMRYAPQETAKYYPGFATYFNTEHNAARYLKAHPHIGGFQGRIEGLQDGEIINLCNRKLRVVCTPGHSPSDIMLVDEENGLLFSGDALTKWDVFFPFVDGADIGKYLQSIDNLERVAPEVRLVLPGHGDPIQSDLLTMTGKSRNTILNRGCQIVKYLQENGPKNLIDIFEYLYHNLLNNSAWADFFWIVITHLKYLQEVGQIAEVGVEPGTFRYVTPTSKIVR